MIAPPLLAGFSLRQKFLRSPDQHEEVKDTLDTQVFLQAMADRLQSLEQQVKTLEKRLNNL